MDAIRNMRLKTDVTDTIGSSPLGDSKFAKLSEGQLAVISLVAQYKSSKEIARALDISPHTVDQRLKRVQAILGVGSRFEAARLFVAAGGQANESEQMTWGHLVYYHPDLPVPDNDAQCELSAVELDRATDRLEMTVRQTQAAYADGFVGWERQQPWYAVLLEAGKKNELTMLARLVCIGGVTLIAVLALAATVSLAEGLSRIF